MPTSSSHTFYLYGAYTFLLILWVAGYQGPDFADDVYYIETGWAFWNGLPIEFDHHLSLRWGAYFFSGLFTYILDYSDRSASLTTLLFYGLTVTLVWWVIPYNNLKKWGILFYLAHVFVIHFLSKVYPDSLLILWVLLVPISSLYRHTHPIMASAVMAMAISFGLGTKETMVFLVPFVFLLFPFDYSRGKKLTFYYSFLGFATVGVLLYLSYYYIYFNDPFFQIRLLNDTENIIADRSWGSLLARMTYRPILILVDNYYWLWIVMAIPSWYYGVKYQKAIHIEFALCNSLLLVGFWLMPTSLDSYHPIELNPRYLIIMIAPLSVSIASGIIYWIQNETWRLNLALLLVAGGLTALFRSDWLVGFYLEAVAVVIYFVYHKRLWLYFAVLMAIPLFASVLYQQHSKNYRHFRAHLTAQAVDAASEGVPLFTNDFVHRSIKIIFKEPDIDYPVARISELNNIQQDMPDLFRIFIYSYYRNAFPEEQVFLDEFSNWIRSAGYIKTTVYVDEWIRIENYRKEITED